MNRSNVGNVITNAAQIMSVGAFTAGGYKRSLGKAEQALNNMTEEERTKLAQFKKDKQMKQAERFYAGQGNLSTEENEAIGRAGAEKEKQKADYILRGVDEPFKKLSQEEQEKYREAQAEGMRKYTKKMFETEDEEIGDVASMMEGVPEIPEFEENSEQVKEIDTKINRDSNWLATRKGLRKKRR